MMQPVTEREIKSAPLRADGDHVRVLYVEDDERLARLTVQYFESHGLEVSLLSRGDVVLEQAHRLRPDIVVLDLMLPGRSGLDVCRDLRARFDVPIIMVTARTEEADRVMGLEGGADDYVSKPFSPRELVARIRSHVRRARGKMGPVRATLSVGDLVLDTSAASATMRGEPLVLTTHEYAMLRAFAESAGRVLSRDRLLEVLHGSADQAFDRSIDVHVSRLRQKLGDDPKNPRLLKTVRGLGYMLVAGAR